MCQNFLKQCCRKTVARSPNATHKWNGRVNPYLLIEWSVLWLMNLRLIFRSLIIVIVCSLEKNTPIALKIDRRLASTSSGSPVKFQNDWRTLNRNLVPPRLNEILGYSPWGRFKSAYDMYELLNLRALKISMLHKNHTIQCMGKIFCFFKGNFKGNL